MHTVIPLIKGMFINSHVKQLRRAKGVGAVTELERRYGQPLEFSNLKNYPVREEVRIIELCLDILGTGPTDPEARSFEAGRLHFRNFVTTPFGSLLMSSLPKSEAGFKRMLLSVRYIAQNVFKNTRFTTRTAGVAGITVITSNNDYPIEHFRGLLYEWMCYWKLPSPSVTAKEPRPRCFVYELRWQSTNNHEGT